jgi:hypothetical protein
MFLLATRYKDNVFFENYKIVNAIFLFFGVKKLDFVPIICIFVCVLYGFESF